MWTLIAAEFRYCRLGLFLAVAIAALVALPFTFWVDRPEPLRGIWLVLVLGLGISASILLWTVEQKERRPLLWAMLPVSPRAVAGVRLLTPILVVAVAGLLAIFGMWVTVQVHGLTGPLPLSTLIGSQAFLLISVLLMYLLEELSILASPWRWAVIAVNVGMTALFLIVALNVEWLLDRSWAGVLGGFGVAVALTAADYVLFVRRPTYLIGVSPLTGCPRDWSEAPARR